MFGRFFGVKKGSDSKMSSVKEVRLCEAMVL